MKKLYLFNNLPWKYPLIFHVVPGEKPELKHREDISYFFLQDYLKEGLDTRVFLDTGEILYELLKNYWEHGCNLLSGKPIEDSFMAVFLELDLKERTIQIEAFNNGLTLSENCAFRKDFKVGEEKLTFEKCFELYGTSSDRTSKGLGLTRVKRAVKRNNGFFQCISGNFRMENDIVKPSSFYNGVGIGAKMSLERNKINNFKDWGLEEDTISRIANYLIQNNINKKELIKKFKKHPLIIAKNKEKEETEIEEDYDESWLEE